MKYLLLALIMSTQLSAQLWTQLGDMPSPRHHPVTFSINGIGYMATGSSQFSSFTDDFYSYDPVNDSWTQLPDFPGPDRSFSIGGVYQGKAYMGFGAGNGFLLSDFWEYDPATEQWTQLATCPCQARRHPAFIIENGKIYVGMGDGDFGNLNDFHVYDISSDSWSQIASIPGPARHHPFQFNAAGGVYAGMGHAGNIIFDDWYRFNTTTLNWQVMNDFPGEARVAGTQFDNNGKGYVLSGDGDNHDFMATGEFWEYDEITDTWTQLTPHPGVSRWAPGSFVIGNQVFFLGGFNRTNGSFPATMYTYPLGPSSIGLSEETIGLEVFPNPAVDMLQISLDKLQLKEWQLLDLQGRILAEGITESIDVSELPLGSYLLNISLTNGQTMREVFQKG